MILRNQARIRLDAALRRSPVTALLGPRQSGKTTLARQIQAEQGAAFFDLESQPDRRRLQNPELVLSAMQGLVILDEIQAMPELFATLRVLVDRPETRLRFLVLGSASPQLVRGASESLAGRVEFVELTGFDIAEVGAPAFWATHAGAELDLMFLQGGQRFGIEFKFSEAPRSSRSMHIALEDLGLAHLWIVAPVNEPYPIHERMSVWPLPAVDDLQGAVEALSGRRSRAL